MICSKCNHKLPDDSEFCQYCGEKIEKTLSTEKSAGGENVEKVVVSNEIIATTDIDIHNLEECLPEKAINDSITQSEEISSDLKENINLKTSNDRFCKFCGGQIDAKTKKCTGCGKQYFKGIKINKFLITVSILSVIISTSVIINIFQYIKMKEIKKDKDFYRAQISSLTTKNRGKDEKIEFYEKYTAVVPNDGSKKYHIYGCDDSDTSRGFWIYSYSAAEDKGYYACPKCH